MLKLHNSWKLLFENGENGVILNDIKLKEYFNDLLSNDLKEKGVVFHDIDIAKLQTLYKEQAKKEIETEDSKRYEFHKYYTNEIWGMSNGYELCLDEGILGIDGCVKMILDYLKIRNLI